MLAEKQRKGAACDACCPPGDAVSARTWYVYLLRCRGNVLYGGVTTDWRRRLREHRGGKRGARFTRSHAPVTLAMLWSAPDKSAALRLEYRLKRLDAAKKRELLTAPERLPTLIPALAATPYSPVPRAAWAEEAGETEPRGGTT